MGPMRAMNQRFDMEHPLRQLETSPDVIGLAVMMSVRFQLSLRNGEDLLHERGLDVSRETVAFRSNNTKGAPTPRSILMLPSFFNG